MKRVISGITQFLCCFLALHASTNMRAQDMPTTDTPQEQETSPKVRPGVDTPPPDAANNGTDTTEQPSQEVEEAQDAPEAVEQEGAPPTENVDTRARTFDIGEPPEATSQAEEALEGHTYGYAGTMQRNVEAQQQHKPYTYDDRLDYPYYLDTYTQPWKDAEKAPERVDFAFEDAQLINVIRYIENQFNVTFILDDVLDPVPKGGQSAMGTKISFKTHEPLTAEQAWNVFLTFLDMAGLTARPGPYHGSYRITTIDPKSNFSVYNNPLPTYIGVHPRQLPTNDMRVRYVYFVRNASLEVITSIINSMKGAQTPAPITFPELRAIMISDRAYNIQAMMRIVRELDTANQPETMSIIKLKKTDASRVKKLYDELVPEKTQQQQNLSNRLLSNQREQTVQYFPAGTRVIAEPRTNTLIVLGTSSAIEKIESFIKNEIDRDIDVPFKPTHIYTLKHIQASAAKEILDKALQFQGNTEASQYGGVRDGDQYMKPVSVVAESTGNRLIITADYKEYQKIEELLDQIDIEQPQVAIKVMLVNINLDDQREAGTQLRNKVPGTEGLLSDEVNFQTSGLAGDSRVATREDSNTTGAQRLLGDLIRLATNSRAGSTLLTLGSDQFGVWGLFRLLQTYSQTNIISNPFLVAANKTEAVLKIGEERRVQQATIVGQNEVPSFETLSANLTVKITPQISYEDFITLNVRVTDEQFTSSATENLISAGNRATRTVENSVILANREVLALGGLIRTNHEETESGVPVLKNIPGVGYLFKNKQKVYRRNSLLILISPEIIPANNTHVAARYTDSKLAMIKDTVEKPDYNYIKQDPFHRWFFNDLSDEGLDRLNEYMEHEYKYTTFSGASQDQQAQEAANSSQKKKRSGKQRLSKLLDDKEAA